ncbi:MAG: nitrate reductase [Pseudomonadales bacterium]
MITTETIKTTCPYCGVGCGVDAKVQQGNLIAVSGSTDHPANQGRLCVKGSALDETVSHQGRLLSPKVAGKNVDWNTAYSHVASKLSDIIEKHGPDAVAMYVSGQILTEDYYVANKLMKGFIGTANLDTNSRLCMSSAVSAHKRAFGSDTVPGCYEDLELADLVILTGSNLAWAHPIIYQRLAKAKAERPDMKIVVIDPRKTASCDIADLHLPLKPGSDGFLFNGLIHHLIANKKIDQTFIDQHCEGFDSLSESVQQQTLVQTALDCDVSEEALKTLYHWFANTECTVTLFSQGINQSSSGVDKGNAIINCHLISGKIGKPGATPFSITGQPNAMGGREVGGLANQLAAHMELNNPNSLDKVKRFWNAQNLAQEEGLKAVDMFDAVGNGQIKAIWIIATNPVVSMPDADKIKQALAHCDLVIVSDSSDSTDTLQFADVCLPATTWGEKDGTTTNSERRISRQRRFLSPPEKAQDDWKIICEVAKRMGFNDAFNFSSSADIFREHAALSGFENNSVNGAAGNRERDFDISGLAEISDLEYQNLEPVQWPVNSTYPQGRKRFFDDGHFYTASNKANLIPITPRLPTYAANCDQLILNTGRIRDQWHTMTRTGKAHRLLEHIATPLIEIHPDTAAKLLIKNTSLVSLKDRGIEYIARASISDSQRKDSVFVPMHWSDAFASHARANSLVRPIQDALSGQPEFKHSPVTIKPLTPRWQGVLLSAPDFLPDKKMEWFKTPLANCTLWELIDLETSPSFAWLTAAFPKIDQWVHLADSEQRYLSGAGFIGNQLQVILLSGPELPEYDKTWLANQIGTEFSLDQDRLRLLAGFPADPSLQTGKTICACYQVGEQTIINALQNGEANSVECLGEKLKCGSNCGSCIPELRILVNAHTLECVSSAVKADNAA